MRPLLLGILASLLTAPVVVAEPQEFIDLEYAVVDGQSLKLDLFLPRDVKDPPLVLWTHGGGWRNGSYKDCNIKWLTEHGFAVASIQYRLTDKAVFPAQIQDCKGAIRWLRAHRAQYGYATVQIGVAGSSAGGMLAALLGTSGDVKELEGDVGGNTNQSSRVDAVIDLFGPTDFVLRSKTQPKRANEPGSNVYLLLGGGADKKLELAKLASAVAHVTADDPPILVFHGDKDVTVLLDQSKRLEAVYKSAGLPIELEILKGSGHGGRAFFNAKNKKKMVAFLEKHLKPSDSKPAE